MVRKAAKASISEDDGEAQINDESRKRPGDGQNEDGKKRLKTKSLYRQPTVNELNRLQETENLFNSNLFRLQIEEIIQEVKVKEKTEKRFLTWFNEVKNHLLSVPEDDTEYDLTEKTLTKKLKVKLPYSSQLNKTKCVFKFHKFNDVEIVGSYALGCSINSKLVVDLQITIPGITYTKNDSINYRYHKKRSAYVAYIAAHLSKHESVQEVNYTCTNNTTKPILHILPAGKLGNCLSVNLNFACESDAYKLHRFGPERNNLREGWLLNEENHNDSSPTPYYNSNILSDLTASLNQEYLSNTLKNCENLKQAVILLKIWLRQRNLQVSGFIVSALVAYFVQTKRINNIMSSYQIVRNIWIALKTTELDKKGISLNKTPATSIEEFHKHFPVVFLDVTGSYNICWQMNKGTYNALKRESSLAVDLLDNPKINSFIPLFMVPVKPLMLFDHILRFKNLKQIKQSVLSKVPVESKVNYGMEELVLVCDTILSMLTQGLGNRVELILPMIEDKLTWSVKKSYEDARNGSEQSLSFGFVLNPENAMNPVEKGPPANLPEAEEFRLFWGDKSELRRFQDGSITETCVWNGETMTERRTITKQIVDYLMELKYDIKPSLLYHIIDQLDSALARKQCTESNLLYPDETALAALQAFDELRRDLRQLDDLPLDVSAVYGVSPVFSYSSPLPSVPVTTSHKSWRRAGTCLVKDIVRDNVPVVPEYVQVSKAIVELGYSGKWPGDIHAFRCLKAAFHLQIAERLNKKYSIPTQAYPTHIDVLKNGLVFRLEIAHPKEITLSRRVVENGVTKFVENDESKRLQCETVLMPRLRGALHGLHQKHPSYGPTVCLFKRWLSSHLLSPPHVPRTLAELMVASVYLQPGPSQPPASPSIGFIRVLNLLVQFDWGTETIVLDFNEDMSREEITSLEKKLNSEDTKPPIRIITAYDGTLPCVWSCDVTAQVLTRVRTLAGAAIKYIEQATLKGCVDNILGIFVPSLSGYDVLVHLHPTLVPHYKERLHQRPALHKSVETRDDDVIPVVEFHPVNKYLEELRSAYGDFALFFHDLYGGDVIAVLWKPYIDDYREFQLTNANALTPVTVNGEVKYKVNKAAIVEDFKILGEGLVKHVNVQ